MVSGSLTIHGPINENGHPQVTVLFGMEGEHFSAHSPIYFQIPVRTDDGDCSRALVPVGILYHIFPLFHRTSERYVE